MLKNTIIVSKILFSECENMQKIDIFKTESEPIGYSLLLPDDFDSTKSYPMILFLHGAGERGNGVSELDRVCAVALPKHLLSGAAYANAIVLCPQCPCDKVWNQFIYDVKALCDRVAAKYRVDLNRISVTGLSMGGYGTWEIGMTFPGFFSALAPICGGGMSWRTPALKGKPVWAFHGNADSVVSITNSIDMVNGARKNGALVKFTIFDGVDHNSWDSAYLDTKVIDFLINSTL
jgi:predicted peptidase